MLPDLLHGQEKKIWGDGDYQAQTDVIREAAPAAQDMTNRRVNNGKGEVNNGKGEVNNRANSWGYPMFSIMRYLVFLNIYAAFVRYPTRIHPG